MLSFSIYLPDNQFYMLKNNILLINIKCLDAIYVHRPFCRVPRIKCIVHKNGITPNEKNAHLWDRFFNKDMVKIFRGCSLAALFFSP